MTEFELREFGLAQGLFLLLAFMFLPVAVSTRQVSMHSVRSFELPQSMYESHSGRPIAGVGLDRKEISDLLSIVLSTGLDDEDMRSATALRKELLASRLDMGEGADKGLVLQGNNRLCGATGNCAIWLFRKVGTNWKQLGPKNYSLTAASYGFLPTKHDSVNDLVITTHENAGSQPIEVRQFDGAVYELKESYCGHVDVQDNYVIVPGDCQ